MKSEGGWLLDSCLLIAALTITHEHHGPAYNWLRASTGDLLTCPITEGSLIRAVLRTSPTTRGPDARAVLEGFRSHPRHRFIPDTLSYGQVNLDTVFGQNQVTDSYLAELARVNGVRLATLDKGLARNHPDVADLVL